MRFFQTFPPAPRNGKVRPVPDPQDPLRGHARRCPSRQERCATLVFISYSHRDEDWRDGLLIFQKPHTRRQRKLWTQRRRWHRRADVTKSHERSGIASSFGGYSGIRRGRSSVQCRRSALARSPPREQLSARHTPYHQRQGGDRQPAPPHRPLQGNRAGPPRQPQRRSQSSPHSPPPRQISLILTGSRGIMRPDDAERCVTAGADGVILSNHGGRQLDAAVSPLDVLAKSRALISAPILIDSGYRRGTNIVKELALGANAVLLGRATLYGLAAAGEAGVDHVLGLLKDEVDRTLAQIGCASASQLSPDYVMADGSIPRHFWFVPRDEVASGHADQKSCCAPQRNRWFANSPLEEGVSCELVSEVGVFRCRPGITENSEAFMDDNRGGKGLFRARKRQVCSLLPLGASSRLWTLSY